MKRIRSKTVYEGNIATVRIDTFEGADGGELEREIVAHPGAVGMLAYDEPSGVFWMVRQPREAVGEHSLLEIPAGKLDEEGETPLQCAQRELSEEIGKQAEHWEEVKRLWTSPGFAAEEVTLFFATGISDSDDGAEGDEEELEVLEVPLADLDSTVAECSDAKSLIALHMLRERLAG